MTETPTEETTKNRSGGVHLPMLPDGWHYAVQMVGPGSLGVEVEPVATEVEGQRHFAFGPEHNLRVHTGKGEQRKVEAGSLSEALRLGTQTARTLRDLTVHEEKAAQAREKLLAGIGAPSPQGEDDDRLDTPATLSGVNVESRGGKGVTVGSSTASSAKDADA